MLFVQSLFFLHLLGRKLCCFTKVLEFFKDFRNEAKENPIGTNNGYKVGFMERRSLCYSTDMEDA